jgi:hypothetical protein
MTRARDQPSGDSHWLHHVRNHLSVILGYCDLLLGDIPDGDRKHADVLEMREAAQAAIALLEDVHE